MKFLTGLNLLGGPLLRCAVEEGWGCGERVTTTGAYISSKEIVLTSIDIKTLIVTVTVTEYAPRPTPAFSPSPKEPGVYLEVSQDLVPTAAYTPGLLPIPQPDGRFRSDPIYQNTTRPPLEAITSYEDFEWLVPASTTVTTQSEQKTASEGPVFPSITTPPGSKHELDIITHFQNQEYWGDQMAEAESTAATSNTPSQMDSPITLILPPASNAMSRLHDPMPFTTAKSTEDPGIRPSFPTTEDEPMAVLEVSCLTRSRLLFSDFKITWGPSWDDQDGCRRLRKAMNRRGVTTGWKCKQVADPELGYIMEASGHRPMSPRGLVAGAIREAFSGVSNL
ncbi:uncharacterized protein LAJ45_01505 [Morchella importuna]|uniref:uncharacterized protein n=1 Tax=Morchella importuna TaxID=1174673 RepID=UPI001E8E38AC|nr:uncharacterized protein LAJ45_01505 [Morchella importuna]KAH8154972.1 hypothetical protein LAJ45_01505 [Morchella importuna]